MSSNISMLGPSPKSAHTGPPTRAHPILNHTPHPPATPSHMNARNPYFTPLEEYHEFIRGHPAPIAPNDPDPDDPVIDNILFAQPPNDPDWGAGSVHSDDTVSSIYSLEGGFVEGLHARNLPCAGACEDCAGLTLLPEGVMHRVGGSCGLRGVR